MLTFSVCSIFFRLVHPSDETRFGPQIPRRSIAAWGGILASGPRPVEWPAADSWVSLCLTVRGLRMYRPLLRPRNHAGGPDRTRVKLSLKSPTIGLFRRCRAKWNSSYSISTRMHFGILHCTALTPQLGRLVSGAHREPIRRKDIAKIIAPYVQRRWQERFRELFYLISDSNLTLNYLLHYQPDLYFPRNSGTSSIRVFYLAPAALPTL
jgi:hypothetical protein